MPTSGPNPFTDVKVDDYSYDAVQWASCSNPKITNGIDDSLFSPDSTVTRGQCVTFLYRTLGLGSDGWYQDAANWATRQNLLLGMNLMVSPSVKCPRGAVVTLLYRQLGKA